MDKLFKIGLNTNDTCCVYGNGSETIDHLFFECEYSKNVTALISQRMGVLLPTHNILSWNLRRKAKRIKVDIVFAVINACIYYIWQQRNRSKHEHTLLRPDKLVHLLMKEMKIRLRG
ncbi:uncharacterized protein LOC141601766 [Silene latifolia]|uniref:uncharacterized protein LOC141601766 n=1 Tax=Silene latifolia TaxID=37657 RepID=UPI003D7714CB